MGSPPFLPRGWRRGGCGDRWLPHPRAFCAGMREPGVPTIHFGTGTAGFLDAFQSGGGGVIGVDWRVPLDRAWSLVGADVGIQGNLDPMAILGPPEEWRPAARDVLEKAAGRPGHVFNLGHGVVPSTPPENLRRLVEFVHTATRG